MKIVELQAAYEAVQTHKKTETRDPHFFGSQLKSPVVMTFRNIASRICPNRHGAHIVWHIEDVPNDMKEIMLPKKGRVNPCHQLRLLHNQELS